MITKYDKIYAPHLYGIHEWMPQHLMVEQDNIRWLLKINKNFNTIILNEKLYNHYFDKQYKLKDVKKFNIKTKLGLFINQFDFDGLMVNVYINNLPIDYRTDEFDDCIKNFIIVCQELDYNNLNSELPYILHFCDIY